MAIEVELKAKVDDPDRIRNTLNQIARHVRSYEKKDTYFTRQGLSGSLFRIRRDAGVCTVTYKKKSREDGIEVNREYEFNVSDELEFIGFCDYLGYTTYIEKKKTGDMYSYDQALVELTLVDQLGWFVEIEYIIDDESEIDISKEKLNKILSDINISRAKIESRYYTEILLEQKREG